jgi:hypothetical protein
MSRLTAILTLAILLLVVVTLALVTSANAAPGTQEVIAPEYDDPGIPWGGSWVVTKVSSDEQTFWLRWRPTVGYCDVEVKTTCLEADKPAAPVGTVYERTGNQKFETAGYQDLRWQETLVQKCYAWLAKLGDCPVCPDCINP